MTSLTYPLSTDVIAKSGRRYSVVSRVEILEAGVGMGPNFPFYPSGPKLSGLILSPAMLAQAERRRATAATTVELRQMDVSRLNFPYWSFDAAVATFLFCTLPDELQVTGMRELGRVVKPGGVIRCLEYTRPAARFADS